jgi:hypothetical protein
VNLDWSFRQKDYRGGIQRSRQIRQTHGERPAG